MSERGKVDIGLPDCAMTWRRDRIGVALPRHLIVGLILSFAVSRAYGQGSQAGTTPTSVAATAQPAATASTQPTTPTTTPMTQATTQPTTVAATLPAGAESSIALNKVVVSASLDAAREQIAPALGAVQYTIGPEQILAIPGGESASFQQVMLRMPGVVEDSFGQVHIRGEHANATYRVNGVLLPQPLSGFAQELDTHMIQSVTLIDGSLPAQFGFHTAGIIDVTTKSGATLKSNEFSIYGGSHDTIQPSFEVGGNDGQLDYFITGSYVHNSLGIENPTSGHDAIHDDTDQQRLFGYFNYTIDDTSRVSVIFNAANSDFQIPNAGGVAPAFDLAGVNPPTPPQSTPNSRNINDDQYEQNYYSVVAYQKSFERLNLQLSAFSSYGQIHYTPDVNNDLVFQGVAGNVYNNAVTNGLQFDSSYMLTDEHTLRGGFLLDYTNENLNSNTWVFPVNGAGDQSSNVPENIANNSGNYAWDAGVYLQDEWKIAPVLTLNYGLRYDHFKANFDSEGQVSPRLNLVWDIDKATTAHIGYSRFFVPPPIQNVDAPALTPFQNTTNAPNNNGPGGTLLDNAPKAERSHYFDAGISHQISKPWSLTLDGFFKQAHNLVDEGQFGAPVIETPFNYKTGRVYGAEISSQYTQGGLSIFGNGSWVETAAHDIDSQEFTIDPAEYQYILNHNIHLDHESEFSVSSGISYAWKYDFVYLDFLYGNGLRTGFANTGKEPEYYPVNIGYQHIFKLGDRQAIKLRFDITNLFDESYQIRSGSGIGVGAPQYGARRGFFVGLAYDF
jgi:outer membrane receptor protein involved in Fe transport